MEVERKVGMLGDSPYIRLPMAWVKAQKVRTGDIVRITIDGEKLIIVKGGKK